MNNKPVSNPSSPAGKNEMAESWRLAHQVPFLWKRMAYVWELFTHLVSLELRLLYKRSWLGLIWTLLNPVIQLAVFTFVFTRVLSVEVKSYPLFLCCGILCWNAFTETLISAAASIVKAPNVLYQPGFQPFMLPVVMVGVGLVHFVFSLVILAVLLVYYQVQPGWPIVALPLIIGIQTLLALALAFPLAALNVSFHDVRHLLTVVFRFMFFLTPVLYATDAFPRIYQMFYATNPLTHLIKAYRAILMDGVWPDWLALSGVTFVSLILLVFGFRYFESRRFQFIEDI